MQDLAVVRESVEHWLDNIVIGLNLCPFAKKPRVRNQIKIAVCESESYEGLLAFLQQELETLVDTPLDELETTVIASPNLLIDFFEYNQFLDVAEGLVFDKGLEGVIQIASFHPDYQFADTDADDLSNYTNRAPYPLFHLIREDSLEQAIASYKDSDLIPDINIEKMNSLQEEERKKLFYYLYEQSVSS
ncbi:MAG: DUF1415 domain-containing protein [Cellvibrionaceae bacterium]